MDCDCAIIGAGPGGLHCATYLGRFNRRAIVFDGGRARAAWIPKSYNFPGFLKGVTGEELLRLLRRQAEKYYCTLTRESVKAVEGSDGRFIVRTAECEYTARKVVFATGVEDIPPEVPDALRHKGRTIRHCPVCDAYESRGKRLVLFGVGDEAARKALWLSHFTNDITICTMGLGNIDDMDSVLRDRLDLLRIRVIERKVESIEEEGGTLGTITFDDGSSIHKVDRGYSAMGLKPNSDIAASLDVSLSEEGFIVVDDHQRTNVPGVYAIGDVVAGQLAQIAVAFGHAALAACDIHNSLLAVV